ncbi:MAG: alkaline phosphatase D family protein [Casimicrobium sp.]
MQERKTVDHTINPDEGDDGYPERGARRRWLQSLAASALASQTTSAQALLGRAKLAFPPAAFDVSEGRALIGVIGNRALSLHVRWSESSFDVRNAKRTTTAMLNETSDFAHAFALNGLPPSTTIAYALFDGDNAVSDVQRFRTSPNASTRGDFVLAFSGDMEERYKPFRIFDRIAEQNVDAFLHLGDTVYADIPRREFTPTVSHYRRKHSAIRSDAALQSFMSRHAMIATWDDHEIENDSHGGHPAMREAAQVFGEYWPSRSAPETGLYRKLVLGKELVLFVLDTRRFRSVQAMDDGAEKTILGTAQKQRFMKDYETTKAKFRLIASSVPFHGSSQDAWGNYATERDELLAMFRAAHAKDDAKTIVLSADYHFAREWPRNEKRGVYEFMTGPLAAFLTFEKDNAAKARHTRGEHFVFGERANFGVLRYRASANGGSVSVTYYDDRGARLHERTIA